MSRNPIQDNFVILCNQLNLNKILPYLKHERMVTTDEYEILTDPDFTARQKREKLLIWLPRKGKNYFTNFGKCLVWSGQTVLARYIGVDVALVPEAPYILPEDEPTPKQKQQHLHSLSSPSSAASQHAAAPTISYFSSAPVYLASSSGAAGQSESAHLHSPVLTSSPPPPTAVGGGNAPLAHIDQSFQVSGVPPQPASALHPLAPQPVPMDYTSSVSSAYHEQPPGFVLGASVPNEETTTTSSDRDVKESESEVQFQCPCGKCSIETYLQEGCPKSCIPYLGMTTLSKEDRENLNYILRKDTKRMMESFINLSNRTCDSLIRQGIAVDRLVRLAIRIDSSLHDKLILSTSVDQVFINLASKMSFDHDILTAIIKEFGDTNDRDHLAGYSKEFEEFCKRKIFEVEPGHCTCGQRLSKLKGRKQFAVLLPTGEKTLQNLGDAVSIKETLADVLGVPPATLHLHRIDTNSGDSIVEESFLQKKDVKQIACSTDVHDPSSKHTPTIASGTPGVVTVPEEKQSDPAISISSATPQGASNPPAPCIPEDVDSMSNKEINEMAKPTSANLTVIRWKNERGEVKKFWLKQSIMHRWRDIGDLVIPRQLLSGWARRMDDGEGCRAVLSHWLDNPPRHYPATWEGLYELLDDSELSQVATELKQAVDNAI